MKAVLLAIWAVPCGVFRLLLLPISPCATDRITAARLFENALNWDARIVQRRRRWSVLSILKRAARRQERMNVFGSEKFEELQRRKWERSYSYQIHAILALRVISIFCGYYALGAVLQEHFPALHVFWQAGADGFDWLYYAFWGLWPGLN